MDEAALLTQDRLLAEMDAVWRKRDAMLFAAHAGLGQPHRRPAQMDQRVRKLSNRERRATCRASLT